MTDCIQQRALHAESSELGQRALWVCSMQVMGIGMSSARGAFNLFVAALTFLVPLYFMQEVSTSSWQCAAQAGAIPALL